jgi:hypothetical protein
MPATSIIKKDIDNGVAEHAETAPPAASAAAPGCHEPGDREPTRQAGET